MFEQQSPTRAGYIALIGRPNVGKSTLLNKLLGKKVSITSRKSQTTRYKILGVKNQHNCQAIYVDTPGLHESKLKINHYLNEAAFSALKDVDIVAFIVAGNVWTEQDEWILTRLKKLAKPLILVINKIDLVKPKSLLLAHLDQLRSKADFISLVPLSAKNSFNLEALEQEVTRHLPLGPWYFPAGQYTDRDERFLCAEIIREKVVRALGDELPYASSVLLDGIKDKGDTKVIMATIFVERPGQRMIVIGKSGEMIKKIGRLARFDLERYFGQKIFLQLWVKVKSNWTRDANALKLFGFSDDF